jgi:hypothetical protein
MMIRRGGGLLAVLADADVVDVNPKRPAATMSPRRSDIAMEAPRPARFAVLAVGAQPAELKVIDTTTPPVQIVTTA